MDAAAIDENVLSREGTACCLPPLLAILAIFVGTAAASGPEVGRGLAEVRKWKEPSASPPHHQTGRGKRITATSKWDMPMSNRQSTSVTKEIVQGVFFFRLVIEALSIDRTRP